VTGPVIVGGGPAGCAAAIELARAGRQVTLLERTTTAADKVCGDFLSAEAMSRVEALGVSLAGAVPISSLRIIDRRRAAIARLPFAACGLSRRALDEALLRRAIAAGATVLRGQRVSTIEAAGSSLCIRTGESGRMVADTVFLATGKHELRSHSRCAHGSLVGLKMYYRLDPAQRLRLNGHIELMLLRGGYAGLQRIEAGRAVLCLALDAARLRSVGGQWAGLLDALIDDCPQLGDRLAGAQALLERPLAVANLPYGYVYRARGRGSPRLFRLGDQVAVIPSLTGAGVALALASGSLAARIWIDGAGSDVYHRRFAAGLRRQMRSAMAVHAMSLSPTIQPWIVPTCIMSPKLMRIAAAATRARRLTHNGYAS
jgi:flavin-dependent dehydrogenase